LGGGGAAAAAAAEAAEAAETGQVTFGCGRISTSS